ncbi:MAG: hypothetical protein RMM08_00630 [Armatimonadota bacterium]|nr:hypothetical protein [Armatimonadota bacterium]
MVVRHAIWWLMLCAVLTASARAQPFALDVVPGFDGVCPGAGCYPVTVLVDGQRPNAPPAVGDLEVTATSWDGSVQARKLITLPGGVVSQAVSFLLCSPDEPYEVKARLILRGRVLAVSKPVSVTMAQWYPLLVGLGTETSAIALLPQRSLGVVSTEGMVLPAEGRSQLTPPPSFPQPGADNRRLFLGRTRNSLPPESALAYRGVAAVSLDDRAWDTLTERQQLALIGYVLSGGLLVVHGVDINRLQSLMPSGLLPVQPLALSRVPAGAMAGWVPSLGRISEPVDVVRARPLGGAKTLLSYGDTPLVVVASKGLGQVVFLAFDPSQPPFTSNEAAHSLWKNLLRLRTGHFSAPPLVFAESIFLARSPSLADGAGFYSEIVGALINAVSTKPVPVNWLVTYLGVYILVLIPLNYMVLRRLDRLHLSWFTLPVLAVFTSAAGYLMASRVQTSSHQVRQWTALYVASGSPHAIVESDWVLYSARTQRYRLQAKVDGIILENSPSEVQARRVAEIPQEEPADLRNVPIPLWSARTFHLSGMLNMPGTVNISAWREGSALHLKVSNNTPYTLKKISLVVAPGIVPLDGTCLPKSQITLTVEPGARLSIPPSPEPPYPYGYSPHLDSTVSAQNWHEQARSEWFGLVWTRIRDWANGRSPGASPGRPAQGIQHPTNLSQGVLVAEVEGLPQVVEITPLSFASSQSFTVLAVHFDVRGGKR